MNGWLGIAIVLAALAADGEPAASETPATRRAAVRETAREVLSRAEFAQSAAEQPGWWKAFLEWLRGLLRGVGQVAGSLPGWLFWLIVGWMVLALVAALVHMLWTLYQLLAPGRAGAAARNERRRGEILGIRDLDLDGALAQGRALLEQGRFADAVRHFYVAAILELERHGALAPTPAKTNRDYVRELAAAPRWQPSFQELTSRYERSAYSGLPTDRAQCDAMLALLTGLRP
ncbi:MAG: DUF4129 domain-containing protein [Pirellulales bacterium]